MIADRARAGDGLQQTETSDRPVNWRDLRGAMPAGIRHTDLAGQGDMRQIRACFHLQAAVHEGRAQLTGQ